MARRPVADNASRTVIFRWVSLPFEVAEGEESVVDFR